MFLLRVSTNTVGGVKQTGKTYDYLNPVEEQGFASRGKSRLLGFCCCPMKVVRKGCKCVLERF